MARPRAACAALLVLGACRGSTLLVGEGGPGTTLGGDRPAAPAAQRCADPAALRVLDLSCWPTRHVGHWRGFATGDARYLHVLEQPFEFPSAELRLDIAPEGTGQMRFAAGDAGAGMVDAGPMPGLVLGFDYGLVGLSMSGGPAEARFDDPRMDFAVTIAQPWARACAAPEQAAAGSACECGDAGCGISSGELRVSLLLSADGSALRGSASSQDASGSLSATWELVRE